MNRFAKMKKERIYTLFETLSVPLGQKEFQRGSFYPSNFEHIPFGRFSTLPGRLGEFQAGCVDLGGDVGRGFLAVEV